MSINVGTAVGYLDLDASKFKAGLKDAQSTLSEFTNQSNNAGTRFEALGSSLKTVGSTITTAVSLPLLALGAGAIKTASDFEAGMSKVSALSGATGDDLKMLEEKAREMGSTTKYSATESAEALSYMALAGWDAEQMAAGLEPSLKLAGASGMDLALATDIVTDTMSMFGMEASEATKMTDMLAYAQANSNTDVQQLGEALKYCGASANAMGYDLADTTALLGVFADQGLKGSSAGTTLNAMFRDMKAKAKDGAIAIGDTNVAIVDANGNYRDMTDILADVEKATEGMTQAERDMALSSIWGTEALKGVNMAFEAGVPKIREFEEGIRNSDGAANEMYETMQNNLQGAIDNMKSAFEGLLITIGQRLIPIFQNLVEGITNVFTWFNNLNPAIQNIIIAIGGFLAILGPVILLVGSLISNLGLIATGLMTLTGTTTLAAAATSAFGSVIAFITGPIGIAIGVITALIAVGVLLYKNWDTIKAKCSEIWSYICDAISKFASNSIQWLKDKWEEGKQWLADCWNNVKQSAIDIWNSIGDFFSETIPKWIDNIVKWFDELPYKIGYALGSLLRNIIEWGANTWDYLETNVPKWIESVSNWFKELPGKIWQWLTNAIQKISDWGSQTYQKAKDGASKAINSVVEWFSQMPGKVWTWLSNTIQKIEEWGTNMIQKARECAVETVESVVNGFKELPSKIKTIGSDAVKALWDGISSMTSWIKDKVSSFISGIVDGFKGVKSGISSAVGKSRLLDIPDITQKVNVIGESDYSDIKFDYIKAIQTSSSSSIATNMTEELKYLTRSIGSFDNINKHNNAKNNGNSVVINNTYNSPKPASIRELKRQDEIQMRRLAMQLGF